MAQIKILPHDLRNKIAAGEVIERPASAVKELIENSIDAGSTDIKIEVLYGGKRLIRVSDNGTGMDKEDTFLCFERYATSKLFSEEDLFNIRTMGFRGEALSSIASVSRVTLVTAPKGISHGVSIETHGGEVKLVKDAPSIGTTVEVKDLFFNTPARKKFLKKNTTELLHIIDRVTEEALAHYEIGFTFISDNHETMSIPFASGIRERIMQIYGGEFLDGLIEVNAETENLKIQSFVSKAGNFRNSKAHQFLFINKRPIRDTSIAHAVYKAFEGILPHDRHPVFFLFLDIEPGKVDFNVHPTKREVRFEDKEFIYRFVYTTIRDAMKKDRIEYAVQFTEVPPADSLRHFLSPSDSPSLPSSPPFGSVISEHLDFAYTHYLPFMYLGDSFIAISGKGGLTLIDHHAAHERILYEKFLKGIHINSSQLLFPKQVKLSHKEHKIIIENSSVLRDFGIDLDDFGHDTVIVHSLPDALKEADIRGILSDSASYLIEGISLDTSMIEVLAAKIACHKSVRGKIILNQEEISQLLSDLEDCDNPDSCPHGRPTRIFFSLDEMKKMFKRK